MYRLFNLKNLLLICWGALLISINSNNELIFNIINNPSNFDLKYIISIFNVARFFFPFLIFFFLIYLLIIKKGKINNFSYLIFFYSLWQIIVFYMNNRYFNQLNNLQLITSMLCVIMIFSILEIYELNLLYKEFLIMFLVLFGLALLIYFGISIKNHMNNSHKNIYLYYSIDPKDRLFGQSNPRVTGLSRIALILFYFFSFYLTYMKGKKNQIIVYILLNILVLIIYLYQSRGSFFGVIIFVIYYLIFIKKNFFKKIIFLLLIILIPIVLAESFNSLRENSLTYSIKKDDVNKNRIIESKTSSGRIQIWKNSIDVIINERIILGMGPQSDRYLLEKFLLKDQKNNHDPFFESNSSNALIYSYLCGGIIGFTMLLTIYYFLFSELFKTLANKENFKSKSMLFHFSYIVVSFLVIRSIFENSFALFSLDYCLIILSYFTLCKINQNKKFINFL